jgi:hypothetical protein
MTRLPSVTLFALLALATPASAGSNRAPGPTPWLPVPAQEVPAEVLDVIHRPTLTARPPGEQFTASTGLYRWMLDHPDRTSSAWRKLGVPCMPISHRGNGCFGYRDETGTDVTWRVVGSSALGRIWYAEGVAKPGPLMPTVPVKVVAILRHDLPSEDSAAAIRHDVEVYFQTDSRAATLVTRLLGPAAPRMAEQGSGQLLIFFSTLGKYCHSHPEQIADVFAVGQ